MKTTIIKRFCQNLQGPATVKRYRDFGIGVLLVVLDQLVVVPIQIALDRRHIDLPASIFVMVAVFFSMTVSNHIHSGVARFYTKHLQGPTDFLGRHMSLGFVAPFVMLNRDHISDPLDAPKIAAVFVIITIVTYLAAFIIAFGSIKLEQRCRGSTKNIYNVKDVPCKPWPRLQQSWAAPSTIGFAKQILELPRPSGPFVSNTSLSSVEASEPTTTHKLDTFMCTLPIWICGIILLTVGLPVYLTTGYDTPFEAMYFILVWTCCHQLLKSLRASKYRLRFPRIWSTLLIFANPVLLTSGFGTIYFWVKTVLTKTTIDQVATNFRKHITLAEALTHLNEHHGLRHHIGAGDLACTILDAGILCLGMKMFEYRRELAASFYSIMSTCSIIAATSIFFNVALAREIGLEAEEALAFAAKTVTIALGVPAMQKVNGSTTLMSALCIFSGMLFQMSGNLLFKILRIDDQRLLKRPGHENASDKEKAAPSFDAQGEHVKSAVETKLLAAGVTVGINAAAMGTAHLIECDSTSIAYSALSMVIFGAMIVALTNLPGVSDLLIFLASR